MQRVDLARDAATADEGPDQLRQALVGNFFGAGRARPDLSLRELAILLVVQAAKQAQSVTVLTERIGLPRTAVRRAVELLERAGYVARPTRPVDRRTVSVQVTARGDQLIRMLATPVPTDGERRRAVGGNVVPYVPAVRGQVV